MARVGRPGLSDTQKRSIWDLWRQGHSYSEIAASRRLACGFGSRDLVLAVAALVEFFSAEGDGDEAEAGNEGEAGN